MARLTTYHPQLFDPLDRGATFPPVPPSSLTAPMAALSTAALPSACPRHLRSLSDSGAPGDGGASYSDKTGAAGLAGERRGDNARTAAAAAVPPAHIAAHRGTTTAIAAPWS